MAKDNRINMPMSGAGITRYFDESKSKFHIKPASVIIIIILVILIIIALHMFGYGALGIQNLG
ncbi:preprotein translocase subunit Sec61beta [Candidatus Woesearchaeota archaeon]|nr:preprotein translocase subunit Sec61beta [Candidatus Woesearchaeota archaeon]